MVWTWLIITAMSRVYNESRDDYSMRLAEHYDRSTEKLEVSEVLAAVADTYDLNLPNSDPALLAYLKFNAIEVPVEGAPAGAVMERADGGVAYNLGPGALEPLGDTLTLVLRSPSRYVAAWLVPGVAYLHEEYST